MRQIKSERLKKLEAELQDLEQWLKLGLVPKKDIAKHKEEINAIKDKIDEELERLRFLKESGELEEYITPKRVSGRTGYSEIQSLPDIEIAETGGLTEAGFEMPTEAAEENSSLAEEGEEGEEKETIIEENEEEDFFSDRNRWRRGGIIDPEADEW